VNTAGERTAERPLVVRGGILMFGVVILASTILRWRAAPADARPDAWFFVLPSLLAASMVLQYFARDRRSPLMLVSLGLVVASLVLLWLFARGAL